VCEGSVQLYSGHRSVHIVLLACNGCTLHRNDVKKEIYDEKHIDDENEKI
jgi:hypothetical protein